MNLLRRTGEVHLGLAFGDKGESSMGLLRRLFGAKAASVSERDPPPPSVFISHSSADRQFVEREIVRFLQIHGVETWYDKEAIPGGAEWERILWDGLKRSSWFLLVMTPRSASSEWVKKELDWALRNRPGKIIPVMVERCHHSNFPGELDRIQTVSFLIDPLRARQQILAIWDLRIGTYDAEEYCKRAQQHFENKDFDRAIDSFTLALTLDPKHIRSFILRGGILHLRKQYDRAVSDFTEVLRLKPDHVDVYYLRGQSLQGMNEHGKAIADFTEAIRVGPHKSDFFGARGCSYMAKRQYDNAVSDFDEALRISPNNVAVIGYRGRAYGRKGSHDKAIADLTWAISHDPNNAELYYFRAGCFGFLRQFDQAIADYDRTIELNPGHPNANLHRANAFRSIGQFTAGARDDQKARKLVSPSPASEVSVTDKVDMRFQKQSPLYEKAQTHLSKREFNEVIELCSRIINAYPGSTTLPMTEVAQAFLMRGLAHTANGDHTQAGTDYDKAIATHPLFPDAFLARGAARLQQGDAQGAIPDFNESILLSSEDPMAFTARANALQRIGDVAGATRDRKKASELRLRQQMDGPVQPKVAGRHAEPSLSSLDQAFGIVKRLQPLVCSDQASPDEIRSAQMFLVTGGVDKVVQALEYLVQKLPHGDARRETVCKLQDLVRLALTK